MAGTGSIYAVTSALNPGRTFSRWDYPARRKIRLIESNANSDEGTYTVVLFMYTYFLIYPVERLD
jgi:hypothetical protein